MRVQFAAELSLQPRMRIMYPKLRSRAFGFLIALTFPTTLPWVRTVSRPLPPQMSAQALLLKRLGQQSRRAPSLVVCSRCYVGQLEDRTDPIWTMGLSNGSMLSPKRGSLRERASSLYWTLTASPLTFKLPLAQPR